MDNYHSLVSGQAPSEDVQDDCSTTDNLFNIDVGHRDRRRARSPPTATTDRSSPRAGRTRALGPQRLHATPPTSRRSFNQLNAAGQTWKDYDQDLGGEQNYHQDPDTPFQPGRCRAVRTRLRRCGHRGQQPEHRPAESEYPARSAHVANFTGAQSRPSGGTDYVDQYVAKHNPVPWFESLTGQQNTSGPATPPLNEPANGGTNCDANHVVNLDNPTTGLVADLKNNTVPAFSWISPDNCSDAHDAVCKGDNLSGAFNANGSPNYETSTPTPYDPETIPPMNQTGGLYASDLFLEYYIPLIEQSQAFRQGGLIDITFDEGFPPFTYSGNSFNNEPTRSGSRHPTFGKPGTTPGTTPSTAPTAFRATPPARTSTAGTSRGAHRPELDAADRRGGQPALPRARGTTRTSTGRRPARRLSPTPTPANCVPGIVRGGSGSSPSARTDTASPTTTGVERDRRPLHRGRRHRA